MNPTQYLNQLNKEYLAIHQEKEAFFWETYMGISDDHDGSTQAQTAWTQFLSNADKIAEVEAQLNNVNLIQDNEERVATTTGLQGWLATFKAHAIEGDEAQKLKTELIAFEAELFEKKQNHTMTYTNEEGEQVEGSLPVLGSAIRNSGSEAVRRSAHQ